jgi:PBSX family phage terminase large subunit
MNLTKKQRAIAKYVLKHRPKLTILEGAVRSGKTYLNNYLFGLEVGLRYGKGQHFIVTGHTLGSLKRNIVEPLGEMLGKDLKPDNSGTFELFGNKVHCFGADKADSYKAMTGMTAHGWYGNEVTLQHENTIAEAFSRISGESALVFWDTNPDYPEHPIKTDYIDKSGERTGDKIWVKSWHFELTDNPYLPADYIENLKRTTPSGMWYDRRIKGLWVAAEGLVYEDWDREKHVIEPFAIPADWQRFRSVDWGYTNPFVCLWGAVDPDGRLYIYRELYRTQTLIKDLAAAIHQEEGRFRATVADHDAQDNAELAQHGIRTAPAKKDVSIGIQKVAERLKEQGDARPRLCVFSNCTNTIREFGKYAWAERKEGRPIKEEPAKLDDHCMDAVRYMVMEIDGHRYIKPGISAGRLGL